MMRAVRVFGVLLLLASLTACNNSGLARQMVTAPNKRLSAGPSTTPSDLKDGEFAVSVTEGDGAVIAGWVIDPKGGPAKGTVIVLHGFLADHGFVRGAAEALADGGYRAVMLDLRGHGRSTGRHITYGVFESRDMVQVLDYLQKNGLAGESVGVFGTSLGAAVGIQWSAIDPRVKAVVAIAPYATFRDEMPHFAKLVLPFPGMFLSAEDIDQILTRAGEIAHFDPNAANALEAIKRTQAKVLLIHGKSDAITPVENAKRLHEAAPGSELVFLSLHGHLAASYDWGGDTSRLGREFFDKHLAGPAR
jgi:pimeloyl-ACP methyl ester carboxylesterase